MTGGDERAWWGRDLSSGGWLATTSTPALAKGGLHRLGGSARHRPRRTPGLQVPVPVERIEAVAFAAQGVLDVDVLGEQRHAPGRLE